MDTGNKFPKGDEFLNVLHVKIIVDLWMSNWFSKKMLSRAFRTEQFSDFFNIFGVMSFGEMPSIQGGSPKFWFFSISYHA
jgi:hypothetical protein